jgi:hypothetical protein
MMVFGKPYTSLVRANRGASGAVIGLLSASRNDTAISPLSFNLRGASLYASQRINRVF